MYCADCEQNWEYIEGKRSFRVINARDDEHDGLAIPCPQCSEPDEERALRQHFSHAGRDGNTLQNALKRSANQQREIQMLLAAGFVPGTWTIIDPSVSTKEN